MIPEERALYEAAMVSMTDAEQARLREAARAFVKADDLRREKRAVVEGMMSRGPVLLAVDLAEGARVPERFGREGHLVLRFGWGLTPSIDDLAISDESISGTLTFGGVPHHCVVPWPALIGATVEGEPYGAAWPNKAPETANAEEPPPDPPRAGPGLRLVP